MPSYISPIELSPVEQLEAFLQGHDPELSYFEEINRRTEPVDILSYLALARRSGYNFARKVGKQKNKQFVDECQTEALFWLAMTFDELYWDVVWAPDREAFLRRKIALKLKAYWSCRDSLVLSFYNTYRGKRTTHKRVTYRDSLDGSFDEVRRPIATTASERLYESLSEENLDLLQSDILDSVLRDGTDARILSLYCDNVELWAIALQVQRSPEFVHKTLNRIERSIANYDT